MSDEDPIARFLRLQKRAREAGEAQWATAMTLATCTPEGRPSARMVLLKTIDQGGATFYTNFGSRKAAELDANLWAALAFYWPSINVQIRLEGSITRVSDEEADTYFASRSRQSQLGAWASSQSRPLSGRRELIAGYLQKKAAYFGREIPRPPFWGGYRLHPDRIEFWLSRLGRLHDRILYTHVEKSVWTREMLFP